MFRLHAPGETAYRSILDRNGTSSLTYTEIGATQGNTLPRGYTHDRYRVDLGSDTFDRAREGLRTWQAHLGAGVDVYPRDATLNVGTDVIVTARAGPLHALAPCRVVYVIDEPDRFGFAYGTLPGHPECGEESFVIERDARRDATFAIVAFSRPAALAARLGRPVGRAVQRRVTHAYLDALRSYSNARRTTG